MSTDTTVHRDFDPDVTLAQIGPGTVAAVSGGRRTVRLSVEHDPDGTSHPVPDLTEQVYRAGMFRDDWPAGGIG